VFSVAALRLFGIMDTHIVEMPYGTAIFGREVFLIRPLQVQKMNAVLLGQMRAVFVKKLGLDRVEPFRYVLYNRKGKREALNFDNLFDHFNPMFPDVKLELYQDELQFVFKDGLVHFNEMILFMGCHGSGTLNVIFQQRGTVFVVVESKESDGNLFIAMAKIFRRYAFIYRDYAFNHFVRRIMLDLDHVFPLLEMGIRKAIEVSKDYRPIESTTPPLDVVLGPGFVMAKK